MMRISTIFNRLFRSQRGAWVPCFRGEFASDEWRARTPRKHAWHAAGCLLACFRGVFCGFVSLASSPRKHGTHGTQHPAISTGE